MSKNCIIGLGNPLRRDDGIGIRLLQEIKQEHPEITQAFDCIDGGTGGFRLLHTIVHYKMVVLLDAVNFQGKPGEIRVFHEHDVQSTKGACWSSTHGIDMLDVVRMARELETKPDTVIFIGIQPKDISTGETLSLELENQIPMLKKTLLSSLRNIINKEKKK